MKLSRITVDDYLETVALIDTELGPDFVVSFAVEEPGDPSEINSLTLLRMPKLERLLPPEERGISVSYERYPDDADRDMLEEVRYSESDKTVHLETRLRSYDLDVAKVDPEELAAMRQVFRKMNRDNRFRCVGL